MINTEERIKSETIMNDTWNKRAVENAIKYIAFRKTDEEFDESGRLYANIILNKLSKYTCDISNWKVLEIGGGIGRITRHSSNYFRDIVMIDVSSEMIKIAKDRLANIKNIDVYKTNGIELPFPDNSFDLVYSTLVFQHMPKDIFLENLAEIGRVLKNDGVFIFQIFEKKKILNLIYTHWLRNLKNFHLRFWNDPPYCDTWIARAYSRRELETYLVSNKFADIKFENPSNTEGDLWTICINKKGY